MGIIHDYTPYPMISHGLNLFHSISFPSWRIEPGMAMSMPRLNVEIEIVKAEHLKNLGVPASCVLCLKGSLT